MTIIKNRIQASNSNDRLQELKKLREEFDSEHQNKEDLNYVLGINTFNGLIEELEDQLFVYNNLVNGHFNTLQAKTLEEIPDVLIAARIAQKISHKQLAELLGLKEQQIQRYEATDYEGASWTRIVEVAEALGITISFENIMIYCKKDRFDYPDGITEEQANIAESEVRTHLSLIF
ncbi:MAG: XRE family transcriptional regulator [Chitinophagaceae bacterium]|nr:MAG: XRE family transcriptional regulator [Chitinophagaceae bacterium]